MASYITIDVSRNTAGAGATQINNVTNSFASSAEHEQRKKFLQSLDYPERKSRFGQISDHEDFTFEWVFETTDHDQRRRSIFEEDCATNSVPCGGLVDWFRGGEGILLVRGKPGAGKSTFMKFLFNDRRIHDALRMWSQPSKTVLLFHSFWGLSHREPAHNWKGLLANLAEQLVSRNPNFVPPTDDSLCYKTVYDDWTTRELKNFVLSLVKSSENKYSLLIDALDEAKETEISDILRSVQELSHLLDLRCKICLATRPFVNVEMVSVTHSMDLHLFTAKDMEIYVERRLRESIGHWTTNDPDRETNLEALLRTICRRAEGVWIWVVHVLRTVEANIDYDGRLDLVELRQEIETLPEDVHKLYRRSLDYAQARWPRKEKQRSLLLSLGAYFPLPLFQVAIALDDGTRREYLDLRSSKGDANVGKWCAISKMQMYKISGCLVDSVSVEYSMFEEDKLDNFHDAGLEIGDLRDKIVTDADYHYQKRWLLMKYFQTQPWRIETVQFMHRTVYEFLVAEGVITSRLSSRNARVLVESWLVCYLEDVIQFSANSIRKGCDLLKDLEPNDLDVIGIIDTICQFIVRSRLEKLHSPTKKIWLQAIPKRWLYLSDRADGVEYPDDESFLTWCGSILGASFMLSASHPLWSHHYREYLACHSTNAYKESQPVLSVIHKISPMLKEIGMAPDTTFASMSAAQLHTSTLMHYFPACVSYLLDIVITQVLRFFWSPPQGDQASTLHRIAWAVNFLSACDTSKMRAGITIWIEGDSFVLDSLFSYSVKNDTVYSTFNMYGDVWEDNKIQIEFDDAHEVLNLLIHLLRNDSDAVFRESSAYKQFVDGLVWCSRWGPKAITKNGDRVLLPDLPKKNESFVRAALFKNFGEYLRIRSEYMHDGKWVEKSDLSPDDPDFELPFRTPLTAHDRLKEDTCSDSGSASPPREYYASSTDEENEHTLSNRPKSGFNEDDLDLSAEESYLDTSPLRTVSESNEKSKNTEKYVVPRTSNEAASQQSPIRSRIAKPGASLMKLLGFSPGPSRGIVLHDEPQSDVD